MYRWEGIYSRGFDAQLLAPSLKECHLIEVSVAVTLFNAAFFKVFNKQASIAKISIGGTQ